MKTTLIVFHLLAIFLLNGVLFHETYFWDQRTYVKFTSHFRDTLDLGPAFGGGASVGVSAAFFGLFPMPFIDTVRSIAMINFLLFIGIFAFVKKRIVNQNNTDYFLLLYPSLLLYSSLALRDTLVLVFMLLSIYFLVIKDNKLIGGLLSLPLIPLKIQNFLMIYLALYLSMLFFGNLSRQNKFLLAMLPFIGFLTIGQLPISRFTLNEYFTIDKIEFYRSAFFAEQYNYNMEIVRELDYNPISNIWSFLLLGVTGFFSLLLKPFPWQAANPLQIIQSVENLIIFGLLIYYLLQKCNIDRLRYLHNYMKIILITSSVINGLVVFNYGAAVRAKFVFVVLFLVFSIILVESDKKLYRRYAEKIIT